MLTKSRKVTERVAAANRRNARKSTGPRTAAGKRRACVNRYKHGYYAAPDKKAREEMFRLGEDPDLLQQFELKLTRSWRPADDMQAMLVGDLARLYYDKAMMRKVVRATRLSDQREQETAIERVDLALSHEDAISAADLRELGYRGMPPCQAAYDESRRLLDDLFTRNAARHWSGDQSETFKLLYGERPHGVGRMIIDLFRLLAEHPERADAPLDDPAHNLTGTLRLQLATCIEKERLAVMFEERHYQAQKAEEAVGEFGSAWLPGGDNWGKMQMQDARLDRMIDGKVKLLIRLKRLWHSLPEDFGCGLGMIDGDPEFENSVLSDGEDRNSKIENGNSKVESEDSKTEDRNTERLTRVAAATHPLPKGEGQSSRTCRAEAGQALRPGEGQSSARRHGSPPQQLTTDNGPRTRNKKILKNAVRSHDVGENKGKRPLSVAKTQPSAVSFQQSATPGVVR
ncbi:MAG: hypothetical protein ABSB82_16620 [Terriglobia bacterium]